MKYILLMNTMKAGDYGMATWPKTDQQAHLAYWNSLNKELAEAGEFVVVHGLAHFQIRPDSSGLARTGHR